jgi:mono/diheme cytochrome c family protein
MSFGGFNNITGRLAFLAVVAMVIAGCRKVEMHNQEKKDPFETSPVFADDMASRPLVHGTVVRGQPRTDLEMYTGADANGNAVNEFPWKMTAADLERGKQRFDIYCYVCHGSTGYGDGMIVQRGFVKPQSFHSERLRNAPVGYFFQIQTNGFGAMYSYAARVKPEDRWRIAAYIRALQLSQSQSYASLTPEQQEKVQDSTKPPAVETAKTEKPE